MSPPKNLSDDLRPVELQNYFFLLLLLPLGI